MITRGSYEHKPMVKLIILGGGGGASQKLVFANVSKNMLQIVASYPVQNAYQTYVQHEIVNNWVIFSYI